MKSKFVVVVNSVILLFPKLKSSIVFFDFVSVNISARRRSGFCRRSAFIAGEMKVVFSVAAR